MDWSVETYFHLLPLRKEAKITESWLDLRFESDPVSSWIYLLLAIHSFGLQKLSILILAYQIKPRKMVMVRTWRWLDKHTINRAQKKSLRSSLATILWFITYDSLWNIDYILSSNLDILNNAGRMTCINSMIQEMFFFFFGLAFSTESCPGCSTEWNENISSWFVCDVVWFAK